MAETFHDLRGHILDYLYKKGINPAKRFHCLNPNHLDRNPSMGYDPKRQKVHCFACQADYDLFDLLMLDHHLASPREALALAQEIWGQPQFPQKIQTATKQCTQPESSIENNYIQICAANTGKTDYFLRRGLSSATITRFSLGYDPERDCVVLPCDGGHVVRRLINEKRYLNETGIPSPLFQPELLRTAEQTSPVFLVEGTFDALSAEELGFRAVGMNGAGNREKVAEILRELSQPVPIALIPDRDPAGEAWAKALTDEFSWLYQCPPVPTGKDLNESLVANRQGTERYLQAQVSACLAQMPPPYKTLSAAGQLDALDTYIRNQAQKPRLSTGFSSLDQALDGGLYNGLYVLGAISSLGKTAFCMQIADALARQGQDVLIFSLEMTAFELMARSISRETFLSDTTRGHSLSKTVRGILDGRRYEQYTLQETTHLQAAQETYRSYAGHLWFREGDHETSLEEISAEIVRHMQETGVTPVVLIDYLQIIAPVDVHFTDKQNLDRIVCGLKKLSRTHGLTILAISSFNRENYNLEVSMSAFKESGGIDYSADVLMGLQARGAGSRAFNMDEEKRKDPRELELKILKNRSAALGNSILFRYYPAFSFFQKG